MSRTPASNFSHESSSVYRSSDRTSATYGISDKARCIIAQTGLKMLNRFFVGTTTLKEERNQIHHIEVSEDVSLIERVAVYEHQHEIWHMASCPSNENLLVTVYNSVPAFQASLWRIDEETKELEELMQLGGPTGTVRCTLWRPSEMNNYEIASIDDNNIRLWDLNAKQETTCLNVGDLNRLTMGCWDPHVKDQIVTASGPDIIGYDIRQQGKTFSVNRAHGQFVRDLDMNPNNHYFFVSGGDDCKIKFWDQRKPNQPQKVLAKHSHWVWRVQYNPKFDALLISSSTDGTVNLWNVRTLAFKNSNIEREIPIKRPDKLVKSYDDHEDSVYAVCWSASDADDRMWDWATFASLSYDGRVVINRVPHSDMRQALGAG